MPGRSTLAAQIAAGATLAGWCVGAAEGLYRGVPLPFAVALYGALWAAVGLLAALLLHRIPGLLRWPLFGWTASLATATSVVVLGRFILFRDVLQEAPEKAGIALLGGTAAGLLVAWVGGGLTALGQRLPLRSGPWLWIAPVAACIFFAAIGAITPEDDAPATAPAAAMQPLTAPHVILVVVDALRADAVGAYGASPHRGHPGTPALDAFAAESRVFSNVSAQASWTKPAMASMFTSRLVSGHGTMSKTAVLPKSLPTLASVLQEHHVATGAVVTNYNLDSAFGYSHGFDHFVYLPAARYLHAPPEANRLAAYNTYRLLRERFFKAGRQSRYFYRSGQEVNAAAFAMLDSMGNKPAFVWLHYMEAHDPYFDIEGTSWARVSDPNPPRAAATAMQRAYRDGVARFDAAFAELLAGLKDRNMLDNSLIVVTADHGEEFADHGGFYHGTSLYEEMLHVPLLLHGPSVAVATDSQLTRQIDIAPTLLNFFGVAAPATWEGASVLAEDHPGASAAVAEENHEGNILSSIRIPAANPPQPQGMALKLIIANAGNPRGSPPAALFDLDRDPFEAAALPADDSRRPALSSQLETLCNASHQGGGAVPSAPQRRLDNAAEAELRSLGYVQ